MIIEHLGKTPEIHKSAYVAPDATVCGEVSIADGARIMHGARIIAEGGVIKIGANAIIMENAVVRSTVSHDCTIGDHSLVGPTAHIVGSTIEEDVFLATGTAIFHGSRIGARSVVRIHGTVHVNTVLPEESMVPIGWIAAGNPAQNFSPDQHEALWKVQKPLNFTQTAYGLDVVLNQNMAKVTTAVSGRLGTHSEDRVVAGPIS